MHILSFTGFIFGNLSYIKVITATFWGTTVLALQTGWIYNVCRWVDFRQNDVCTRFRDCRIRNSSNIKIITSIIWEAAMLVLLMGEIHKVRRWDELRWHDIHTKVFRKTVSGIQKLLRSIHTQLQRHTRRHTARWSHEPISIFTKQEKQAKKHITYQKAKDNDIQYNKFACFCVDLKRGDLHWRTYTNCKCLKIVAE
jgi:hypothetical protein